MKVALTFLPLVFSTTAAFTARHHVGINHMLSTASSSSTGARRHAGGPLAVKADDGPAEWANSALTKIQDLTKDFDISGLTENTGAIQKNLFEGELGQRGEVYVAGQFALLLCVLIGGIPVVGDFLMLLLGPVLLLVGLATILLSLTELGESLSPWPVPGSSGKLKTDGIYAQLRHPTYAGLVAFCFGLSILTASATRLFLTAILLLVLDLKADFEEEKLAAKYPDYAAYKERVPGKLFPKQLLDSVSSSLKSE